jgi:LacI family transcriptional regulator
LSNTRQRLSGYADALKDNRIPYDEHLSVYCDFTQAGIKECVASLLSHKDRPDAIFTYNSFMAFEGMIAVKNAGLKIPDDISFTGFANEPIISYIEPQLTAVIPPAYKLGQEAVRLLLKQINSKMKLPPETVMLETKFVINKSSSRHHQV